MVLICPSFTEFCHMGIYMDLPLSYEGYPGVLMGKSACKSDLGNLVGHHSRNIACQEKNLLIKHILSR